LFRLLEAGDKVCFIDIDEKRSADFAKERPNYFIFTAMLLTR